MSQIVSITSQGQITIPALIRHQLGLDKYKKAIVNIEGSKVVIKPIPNIMDLAGILNNKAVKNKNIQAIIKIEKNAVAQAIIKKHSE